MKIYSNINQKQELFTIEDWVTFCPPADKNRQWKEKRSAYEMANFWLNEDNQEKFSNYLKEFKLLFDFTYAYPEYSTKFDNYASPRKNDLCIFAKDEDTETLIVIEGKSDEHYGNNYFLAEIIDSFTIKMTKVNSNKLSRTLNLFNRFHNSNKLLFFRYQLVYWLAGAIDEAKRKNIKNVILISQEFHSNITKERKININKSDLDFFVNTISENKFSQIQANSIVGPINNKYTNEINLYIGKYVVNL